MRSDPVRRTDPNDLARDREALTGRRQHGGWTKYVRGQETGCPTTKLIPASPPYSAIHVLSIGSRCIHFALNPCMLAGPQKARISTTFP